MQSLEFFQRMSTEKLTTLFLDVLAGAKTWEITKPNGEVDIVIGTIHQYCIDNKIGYDSLRDLANGKKGRNKLYLLGYQVRIVQKNLTLIQNSSILTA
jgi:hypothetical protein